MRVLRRRADKHTRYLTLRAAPDKIRRNFLGGVEHIVVPVVALAEGVHWSVNSPQPELVLAQEFGQKVGGWNGRPVVIDHPIRMGEMVSANNPDVYEREVIGQTFGAHVDREGRLKLEAWLSTERIAAVGEPAEDLVRRLEAGESVEVSQASFVDVELKEGEWQGERFGGIWHGPLVPDHLALLPQGTKGACSWEDGCGAPRLSCGRGSCDCQKGDPVRHSVRSQARRPTFSGTESAEWSAPSFSDYVSALFEGDDPPSGVEDASADLKGRIAAHTLLGEADASSFRELSFFPVVNPSSGSLNENALDAVLGGRGSQADIPEEARESAQAMARRLLNEEFDRELEMSGGRLSRWWGRIRQALRVQQESDLSHGDIRNHLEAALVDTELGESSDDFVFVLEVFPDRVIFEVGQELFQRSYTIDEEGNVTLGDDRQEVVMQTEFVPAKGRTGGDTMDREKIIGQLISSEANKFTDSDKDWLATLSDEQLAKLAPEEKPTGSGGGDGGGQGDGDGDPSELTPEQVRAAAEKHGLVVSEKKAGPEGDPDDAPKTAEEWIEKAPAELQPVLSEGLSMHRQRRTELIESLKASEACEFSEDELGKFDTSTLERMAKLTGKTETSYPRPGPRSEPKDDDATIEVPKLSQQMNARRGGRVELPGALMKKDKSAA